MSMHKRRSLDSRARPLLSGYRTPLGTRLGPNQPPTTQFETAGEDANPARNSCEIGLKRARRLSETRPEQSEKCRNLAEPLRARRCRHSCCNRPEPAGADRIRTQTQPKPSNKSEHHKGNRHCLEAWSTSYRGRTKQTPRPTPRQWGLNPRRRPKSTLSSRCPFNSPQTPRLAHLDAPLLVALLTRPAAKGYATLIDRQSRAGAVQTLGMQAVFCPTRTKLRPEIAQRWPNLDRVLPKWGPNRSNSGQRRSGIDQLWPKVGQFRPMFAGLGEHRPGIGEIRPALDQVWPELDQSWPGIAQNLGPKSTKFGRSLADIDQTWPGFDQHRPEIDQVRPKLARKRPTMAQIRPNLAGPNLTPQGR